MLGTANGASIKGFSSCEPEAYAESNGKSDDTELRQGHGATEATAQCAEVKGSLGAFSRAPILEKSIVFLTKLMYFIVI